MSNRRVCHKIITKNIKFEERGWQMEENIIEQTFFDQLVNDENSQMLKAVIPYLPFSGQKVIAAYIKMQELRNTMLLFSNAQDHIQICSSSASDSIELLNDIRKFSYGESRKQLDQITNMLAMIQLLQSANE